MPIYEYRCRECGELFEKHRKIEESDDGLECPHCHGNQVIRVISPVFGRTSGGGSCGPSYPT